MEQTPVKMDCYLDLFFDFSDSYLKNNGNIVRLRRRASQGDELSLAYGDREITDPEEISTILDDYNDSLEMEFTVPTINYTLKFSEGDERQFEVCQLPDKTFVLLEELNTRQKFIELQALFNSHTVVNVDEELLSKFYNNDPFGWFPLKASTKGERLKYWFEKIHQGKFYRYYPLFAEMCVYELTILSVENIKELGLLEEDANILYETIKCASSSISPLLYDLVRKKLSHFKKEEDFGPLPLLKANLIAEWANVPLERAKDIEKYVETRLPYCVE